MMHAWPARAGLYDPAFEREACGVGFVADIRGRASHEVLSDAARMLENMSHRGACGCETNSGDGAGILTALPDAFLREVAHTELGMALPPRGSYAAGVVFLPNDEGQRAHAKKLFATAAERLGQRLLGFRRVPTDADAADLGRTARASEPCIEQVFIAASGELSQEEFERTLYRIRKRATRDVHEAKELSERAMFYVCSLSTKVIVYKGMLTPAQVVRFYPDLRDARFESHLAMVHSRFSTNTFPSWDRAQPLRFMSHNGEINTVRGNRNWMRAREGVLEAGPFGRDLRELFPVIDKGGSDSGSFDNVLEFLLLNGRSLPEAIMMMIPEAWQNDPSMSDEKRAFYEFHSTMLEPWDGPASIAFTDGHYIGAVLDRNGLRPSRYVLTHDGKVIMASEAGVLPIEPSRVAAKGRLQPGRMFLVDFEQGRLIPDAELKADISARMPYRSWLDEHRITLSDLPSSAGEGLDEATLTARMQAFGYTTETLQFMLLPLLSEGRDPIGSMGNDAALAVLSDKPRLVYDYFKQLFAQVTNPPIDSIREEVIMSLRCFVGPEGDLLDARATHAARLSLPQPILSNSELSQLRSEQNETFTCRVIDITWPASEGERGHRAALDRICSEVDAALEARASGVVLTDRATGTGRVPVSALLATGAVHHHLIRSGKRTQTTIIVETGEAREVHHHCLLLGYGADAINPYLAFEACWRARSEGRLSPRFDSDEAVVTAYAKAVGKGILKVMAKMGISTLQSYKGAQIFEALGLSEEVVELAFTGTSSRISGVDFDALAREALARHAQAFRPRVRPALPILPNDGQLHYRADGEKHMWDPDAIHHLQVAARGNDAEAYARFAAHADDDATTRATLRGLLEFDEGAPVPLDEVEPAAAIVKRFCTGAMSFGSLSIESHETLAVAMNQLGGKSNTGEGGEDEARYRPLPDGMSNPKRSAIKQVASGRFGVTIDYLTNADELQIKIAQGAKPGEGGELPGAKVDRHIARIRHSTEGVGLISPPPHHDIYSIEDLAQLIHDLKNANPTARISVKLVAEAGVGTIAAGVVKAHADHLLISGHDGGTGASPLTSIKHAGAPWELGLAETHQTLVMNNLRGRVTLQTDGQLKTGRDVVVAALLGAEEFGFSTAPLITLGCIMMRKCHLNTCPVGIATQDPDLRKKFQGKPEHVINYLFMVAEDARRHLAALGFRTLDEAVGRVDKLRVRRDGTSSKAARVDLRALLTPATSNYANAATRKVEEQDHGLSRALDVTIIGLAERSLVKRQPTKIELPVVNTNRTVGTMLSHEIAKRWGADHLPDHTIHLRLHGSAGQSLGAWLARGVTIELEGDANDFVGKGLSGGRIAIYPPRESTFAAEDNVLIGNVALYGAIRGQAFFRGVAAERFAVRNSGADAVVEGVGDHGCEYMTGGRVVVLGTTGRNFAAGMSGGVAYVLDKDKTFSSRCNLGMVELGRVTEEEDITTLRRLIEQHYRLTRSPRAERILREFSKTLPSFVRVMPLEYKRVLASQRPKRDAEIERAVAHG